jgi:hypothetical protein
MERAPAPARVKSDISTLVHSEPGNATIVRNAQCPMKPHG